MSSTVKLTLAASATLMIGVGGFFLMKDDSNITAQTVMLTSINGGGGSGVIIKSSTETSSVLTNNHVCNILLDGGAVTTTTGQRALVKGITQSQRHDLCLVTVAVDLHHSTKLASSSPNIYDEAIVSGHPALLPNIVTKGHFSGRHFVDVLVEFRKCTDGEISSPQTGALCFFFGGLPIIEKYETVVVTALIMPGSSGSAVYNEKKELSGLVFAGSGEIGYAEIVPYEYVSYFLNVESRTLKQKAPNYRMDITKTASGSSRLKEIAEKCETNTNPSFDRVCEIVTKRYGWEKNVIK